MPLYKVGSIVNITKRAYVATEALVDKPVETKVTDIIHQVDPEFLFYTAKAISSFEPNQNFNGNFDGFPAAELKKAYKTFENRSIFLNHDSDSPLKSIGTILSAEYLEDPEKGTAEVQILGRINRKLHPELAIMIESKELQSTSMGCSVDESKCSVCGHVLHSDADEKCEHLESFGLGKKFISQIDIPELGIHKGSEVVAGSINYGISFTEDSIVNIPADNSAKILGVVASNMRKRLSKTAALTKEETLDFVKQFENLLTKVDIDTQQKLKAEFCGICPPVNKEETSKESSMADKNVLPNDEQKKILSKLSALEMEQLESYVAHKTKKANEIVNKEVVADAASKEETFLSKIVAKVKNSFAAELLEKKIETVAKEEMGKKADAWQPKTGEPCFCKPGMQRDNCPSCEGTGQEIDFKQIREKNKQSSISAKFQEDKNNVLDSTWSVNEGDKCVLEASLKDIWGSQFETLSFEDQKWATSEAYGKEVVARYTKEGLEKLADLWDVTHKLSKTALDTKWIPEQGRKAGYYVRVETTQNDLAGTGSRTIDGLWAYTDKLVGQNATNSDQQQHGLPEGDYWYKVDYFVPTMEEAQLVAQKLLQIPNLKVTIVKELGVEKEKFLTQPLQSSLKIAAEPKLGPSGTRVKPSTGSSNKEHNIKNSPVTKPGQETAQKGPAAPAHQDMKTDPKFKMPAPEAGQKGPAAPKPMVVKTDYSEPKPETDGKEIKTTPKNPDEKAHEKSEKEVKTDYVAEGKEHMEEEEKENKKVSSINYKQANSQIKWSAMSPEAQAFIKKHVEKHIKEDGMERAQAVAAAYSEAREKGMDVPSKKSSQEPIMEKKAADKPMESVDGSTLPEGKKKFDAKPDEAVQGTTLPEEGKSASPETSAQGDKEHKTPDLTKKPTESVDGTTLPPQGKKDEESAEKSTHPDGKKEMGDESEKSVQASKTMGDKPEEAVQDKPELSKKTMGDKAEQSAQGETEPKGTDPKKAIDEAVKKEAATEMPMPEDKDPMGEAVQEEVMVDEKPAMPAEAPKAEMSAFDAAEKLDIGEGYSAHKDKESHEVIISKDGKEVKRLPDGFGADPKVVVELMKSVLGLPPEANNKMDMPDMTAPMGKEEPKMEEHPALEEAHEDELGVKESALKVKEAELLKKEAALKAKEDAATKEEATKKFASVLQARSERCRKIVAELVDKSQLSYDKAVYESELQNGAHLLDARKKAFEASITAKMKEFISLNDDALSVMEATVKSLQAPVQPQAKKASRLFVSPQYNEQMSEEEEIAKIFKTMGNSKQHPQ